jgi:hypothetical protein
MTVENGMNAMERTSVSKNSSSEMTSFFAASSAAFFSDFNTNPGGKAWRYLQSRPIEEEKSAYEGEPVLG